MAEVRLTLEEYDALRRLITSERESEGSQLADSMAKQPGKKRKRTKRDRAMSRAVAEANARYRKKNGQFLAGS